MACVDCLEYEIPECIETLTIDALLTPGVTYTVVFENHFGKKTHIEAPASAYTSLLDVNVSDLGEGYLFRGNTYKVKLYDSEAALLCDDPVILCAYSETCLTLKVVQTSGAEDSVIINCC